MMQFRGGSEVNARGSVMMNGYHVVIAGGFMATTGRMGERPPRIELVPRFRIAAVALIAAMAGTFGFSSAGAQSAAPPVPPTVISTTPSINATANPGPLEMQGVPAERTTRTNVKIEPVEEDYRIGTQDLLEVQVLGVQDLKRDARVNAKGLIGLPLIGAVRVQGLTTAEAEALIGGLYRKEYLQNPEVSVFVKEFTRQSVTLDGAVAKPGQYALKGPTTLLQAIANAGGQGSLSDMSDVVLFRMEDNERRAIKFDVTKIRAAEAPDPLLVPGDLIVVNRSPARVAIRDSLLGDIIGIFNPFNYVVRP